MSFGKPKTPKPQPAPAPVVETINEEAVDETERAREAKRQGYAAALLTGPRGLADRKVGTATRALLGG